MVTLHVEKNIDSIDDNKISLIIEFIKYVIKSYKLSTPFKLHLVNGRKTPITTTACYSPSTGDVHINVKDRLLLVDILRSIAHELAHHKQNELGMLNEKSGDDTSKEEGVANRIAGIMIRRFGKIHDKIYGAQS